ncbi:MAG: FAD-dependent oxidoreductase [Methanocellales archaeon]
MQVLVVGAGVAGMKAALELAEYGYRVTVVEKQPSIGGKISQLDRQFPNNRCGLCQILPLFDRDACEEFCLRRVLAHKNIRLITNAEVARVEGEAGKFKVDVIKKARGVNEAKCIACDKCAEACSIEVSDEFSGNFSKRKAIYVRYPLCYPNVYVIDWINCIKCGKCAEICPTKAVDLEAKAELISLEVGAIILAPGFEGMDVDTLRQYKHGRYPDVVTSLEFERLLCGYGPSYGNLVRPSTGSKLERIAFLQCVGSRDFKRDYCSSACCMYALKEAIIAKERAPDLDITIYYMDLRCFGKGYHRYYENAKQKGIKFIRCRVPVIESTSNGKLAVSYVDENDEGKKEFFDLVVLSAGQAAPRGWEKFSRIFNIELNEWGFAKTKAFNPVESTRKGIYVCGSFTEPKDIPDAITEASAAVAGVMQLLSKSELAVEMQPKFEERGTRGANMSLLICTCGGEISEASKLREKYIDEIKVEVLDYLCQDLAKIRSLIGSEVDRVVIAACAPYGIETVVKETIGLPFENVEIVDIKHLGDGWRIKKNIDLAIEKLKSKGKIKAPLKAEIVQRALVIGGGIAGMEAALGIANAGYEVDLVEKTSELGGNLKYLKYTLEGEDVEKLLELVIQAIENQKLINVYKNSMVVELYGYAGNYTAKIKGNAVEKMQSYGAVVLATGGEEYLPSGYLYGKDPRIITQRELEAKILKNDLLKIKSVVMLQCIGSRNERNRYCSRICCAAAIKNAIKLKEKNPEVEIYILNKDIVAYGFAEHYYTLARKMGITFLKYEGSPSIELNNSSLTLRFIDSLLKEEIAISPSLIVLSTGIVPSKDNPGLAELLKVELDEDGFFKEANSKFRPVDFAVDGIYIAGLAHSPRGVKESITQGLAAAARVSILLSRNNTPASRFIASVSKRWCVGCGLCIEVCPFGARRMNEEDKVVEVIEYICKGCGACAAACPSGAAQLLKLRADQAISMIDLALEEGS